MLKNAVKAAGHRHICSQILPLLRLHSADTHASQYEKRKEMKSNDITLLAHRLKTFVHFRHLDLHLHHKIHLKVELYKKFKKKYVKFKFKK